MDFYERSGDIGEGSVSPLYDRLAFLLGQLPPERRIAFAEYLDEQTKTDEDRGPVEEGDPHKREVRERDSS